MKLKHFAKQSLHNLGDAATKRIVKQFAATYHFVYFGHVDPREDEYELVRGVTVSTSHSDNHYTVGAYNGHDVIFVERRNTLTYPGKPDVDYRWLIMQIDLHRSGLPHMFVDAKHHDAMFYANAFVGKQHMQDITSYVVTPGTAFAQNCKVFANPSDYSAVATVLTPEVAETLARHFSQFDYELFDDCLLVYASNTAPSMPILNDMLRLSLWLAEHCNSVQLD